MSAGWSDRLVDCLCSPTHVLRSFGSNPELVNKFCQCIQSISVPRSIFNLYYQIQILSNLNYQIQILSNPFNLYYQIQSCYQNISAYKVFLSLGANVIYISQIFKIKHEDSNLEIKGCENLIVLFCNSFSIFLHIEIDKNVLRNFLKLLLDSKHSSRMWQNKVIISHQIHIDPLLHKLCCTRFFIYNLR